MTPIFGFILSLIIILLVARKNLPLAIFCGAIVLGIFTLPLVSVLEKIIYTLKDLSIILLALAMGVIPMIGGTMKESGQLDDLVNNLRIGRKGIMASSSAMMGMLPMPGGALLSAPIIERAGEGVPNDLKVAVNNWFRHLFILIYPLSSELISSAKIAGLSVYAVILYILPFFALALFFGYIFLLRKIHGHTTYLNPFSLKKLLLALSIVLIAPFFDFGLKKIFYLPFPEIATVISVGIAFVFSFILSEANLNLKKIAQKMKPWNFTLIIITMFIFLNIFKASHAAKLIASLPLSPIVLCITIGFILGLATGRVLLPSSIVLPIYLTTGTINPLIFALIYTSTFFGYIISPVHPCVCVTLEYFNVSMKNFLRLSAPPALIIFGVIILISLVFAKVFI